MVVVLRIVVWKYDKLAWKFAGKEVTNIATERANIKLRSMKNLGHSIYYSTKGYTIFVVHFWKLYNFKDAKKYISQGSTCNRDVHNLVIIYIKIDTYYECKNIC